MKLLLIEDEHTIAMALRIGLEKDGFEIDVAADGATGLWMATEHSYGVILLDLMLPEMDGCTLCKKLRLSGNATPILMLTAKGEEFDIANGLAIGADDYLAKPFSYMILLARIKALLRRPRNVCSDASASSVTVGALEIDYIQKRVLVHGLEVHLTKREFDLLETIVLAAGRVLSKQFLLNNVWGDNFEGDKNIVEVYIGYIRRKLSAAQCNDLIKTVRGSGYRVEM